MTVHADVTSHESQQEYDRNCFPQFSGGRGVDVTASAIRAIRQTNPAHTTPIDLLPNSASSRIPQILDLPQAKSWIDAFTRPLRYSC
jgi:hypothetical protein